MKRAQKVLSVALMLVMLLAMVAPGVPVAHAGEASNTLAESEDPLWEKSVLFSGDSISYGHLDDVGGYSWGGRIGELHSMDWVNASVSAATVGTGNGRNRMIYQLAKHIDKGFDYVIMQGGVNDCWATPIGAMSNSFNLRSFDNDTFAGALEELFFYAYQHYGNAKFGYIINFRFSDDVGVDYLNKMESLVEMAKNICDKWGIPYLDLFHNEELSGKLKLNTDERATLIPDNIHPNAAGYEIITPYINNWMSTVVATQVKGENPIVDYLPTSFSASLKGTESLFNAAQMTIGSEHAGFSGTGYVQGFYCNPGAHITFTVEVPADGEYDVVLGYAMGTNEAKGNPGTLNIYVNRNKVGSTTFEPGATWATYLQKSEKLTLKAGVNTITYWAENEWGDPAPNVDYIEIGGTKYEAEDAQVVAWGMGANGNTSVLAGFYLNSNAAAKYTVYNVPKAGKYTLTLTYANGNPEAESQPAKLTLLVNDKYTEDLALPHTENWNVYNKIELEVELSEGNNTITLWKTVTDKQGANIKQVSIAALDNTVKPFDVIINASNTLYMPYGMGPEGTVVGTYAGGGYGAHITFPYEAAEAGTYSLKLNQAFGRAQLIAGKGETIYLSVYDNGNFVKELSFPITGDWGVFAEIPFELDLTEGMHYITFWHENTNSCGGPNIDYLDVKLGDADATRLQAEEVGAYQNAGMWGQPLVGFYMNRLSAAMFTIENVPADGYYNLALSFQNGNPEAGGNDAKLAMLVNGQYIKDTFLADQDNWGIIATQTEVVYLKAGTNTVRYWRFDMTLPDPLRPDDGGAKAAANLVSLNVTKHTHTKDEGVVTPPTCTDPGFTTYICSKCTKSYVDDYVDATGHAMGDWTETKPATETEEGEAKRECANCDYVETQEIPKKDSSFNADRGGLEGLFNANQMSVSSEHAGFSGTGFVAGFYCNPGAHLTFTVNAPADGEYDVTLGYAMGTNEAQGNPGTLAIYVNRNKVGTTTFEPGATWATYLQKTEKLTLKKGENTITYWAENAFGDPAPNIDYIEVGGTRYEAEDAVYPNHMGGAEQLEGFYNNPEAAVQYTITNVPSEGKYYLSLNYSNGNPEAQDQPAKLALLVNGKHVSDIALACTGTWADYRTYNVEVYLAKGTNTITLWKTGTEPQGANLKTVTISSEAPKTGDDTMLLGAAAVMVTAAAAFVLLKKKEEVFA